MKIKTIQEKENDVIGRKEIEFELSYEKGTPNRKEILDKMSREYNSEKEKIVVRDMHNIPGVRRTEGKVYIYDSKEGLEKYELKYIKGRWKELEEPQKDEGGTEEKEESEESEESEEEEKSDEEEAAEGKTEEETEENGEEDSKEESEEESEGEK